MPSTCQSVMKRIGGHPITWREKPSAGQVEVEEPVDESLKSAVKLGAPPECAPDTSAYPEHLRL